MKPLRWIQFQSIQSGMAAAFACLILFTAFTMSAVAYRLSENSAQQTAQQYSAELVKQVKENIQTYIGNMENISLLAMNNRDVREYLSGQLVMSPAERASARQKIEDFFHTIATSRQDIASINVFGKDGRFVSDRSGAKLNPNVKPEEMSWYRKAVEAKGDVVISPSHVQAIYQNEYRWVVSLSRELRGSGDMEGSGVFLVDLNSTSLPAF
ncbi:cache domain-containing protein [Gordoniibacillus kamchatkensis]|uniref:cache domain-containing protein n=1 Tax=Gordoniibacillus kamchatkensis TaxID=1590651 RepID=UPI000AF362E0|nr:cache domain-containing protein [Paenibacillus sp. VKM B-2647]